MTLMGRSASICETNLPQALFLDSHALEVA